MSTTAEGTIVKVNETFLALTGYSHSQVIGRSFAALLSMCSALLYETRCLPILRLEGAMREVALEIRCCNDTLLSILVNCTLRESTVGQPPLFRLAVFDSTARRDYERDLLEARRRVVRNEGTSAAAGVNLVRFQ